MQGVRASAAHERQGHKRPTSEDGKASCFLHKRKRRRARSIANAESRESLFERPPQDLSRLYLPVSTVSHYEFRGAAHPRACRDFLTRAREREPLFFP